MAYGMDIDQVFSFHPPATPAVGELHDSVRTKCRELAHWLDENLPGSPEATTAIRKLQETMMHANAAIAIHTPKPRKDDEVTTGYDDKDRAFQLAKDLGMTERE